MSEPTDPTLTSLHIYPDDTLRTALTPTTDGEREAREAVATADREGYGGRLASIEIVRHVLTLLATERAKAADVRLRGAAYLNTANAIERGAHTKVTP